MKATTRTPNCPAIDRGGNVRKTLFVVAITTALLLAAASSAFAVNHSGQLRLGVETTASAVVSGTVTAGAGTNTYFDWSSTATGNAGSNSPHGNFTTTTVKCVVCHSVHYAAPGGAPVGSGQTADTLLRMRADQACIYCHATAGIAVNGTPVYNGLGTALTLPGATGGSTNTGHMIGTNCNECHSSVHGANADHSVASLDGYLLKTIPQASVTSLHLATTNMLGNIQAIDQQAVAQGFTSGAALAGTPTDYQSTNSPMLREQAVGVFCAQCHNGSYDNGAPGASNNISGSGTVAYAGHRIAAAATTNWNADHTKSSAGTSGTIAWAAATNCKSCHDSTDTFGNGAFPHAWGQDSAGSATKMWLLSGADAGSIKTAVGAAASNNYKTSPVQLTDGVCLKCHVAPGGTAGVGITF